MLGECRPGSASPACPSEGAGGRSAERSWPLMCRAAAPARGPRAYPARLTSSEHACPTSGLLCGRLLVALVESVLRPGGWENMCRLMCHCVRHIDVDNKHGRSVEAIHSFLSRWMGEPLWQFSLHPPSYL